MSRGFFITGTDTGIGKTVVTAGVLRWLRGQGVDAVPMKPVQTGAERKGDKLVSPDLEFCFAASDFRPNEDDYKLMLPYIYEPACSPHLAGRLTGKYPEIPEIKRCSGTLLQKHQALIVEGSGGVLVPLNETMMMLDLMKELDYPVILVARAGLGTINHSLLSIHMLNEAGLNLMGVVFNHIEQPLAEDEYIDKDNPDTIVRVSGVAVLGRLRYLEKRRIGQSWYGFEEDMPGLAAILDEIRK